MAPSTPRPGSARPHRSRRGVVATSLFVAAAAAPVGTVAVTARPAGAAPAVTEPKTGSAAKAEPAASSPWDDLGTVQQHSIESDALGGTVRYRVLVTARPPAGGRLDLLVLLHGANAHDDQWDDVGIDDALLARARAGRLRPTLLVLPDGDSPSLVDASGDAPLARFVLRELVPSLERRYPVSTDRAHRMIGGISRGGGWALTIASAHPDVFGAVGGHSAVVPTGRVASAEAAVFAAHHTRVWLDVGDSDALRRSTEAFAAALRAAHATVSYAHHPGGHQRAYWRSQATAYAAFYGA